MYLPHWPIPATIGKQAIDYESVFERISVVLEKLDNPHQKLKNVIHIAGTNGKGSSAALLLDIYQRAGYKVNCYTSPQLHDCNERVIINGQKISDNYLTQIAEEVRVAAGDIKLTFMEGFTLIAFLAFSKNNANINIIECGMGGRIDATNIIPTKIATLITPISYDHMEYLGDTIEKIALEKAMIIRPSTPLIVSSQSQKAKNIIKILANDQKIQHYYYDEDFDIELNEDNSFDFNFQNHKINNIPRPSLLGDHQYINAASVIALVKTLENKFNISNEVIKESVKKFYWPGRLENITNKLTNVKNSTIYIDGAHNVSGAFALRGWLLETAHKYDNIYIITGFSKNKCKKEFLANFSDIANILAVRVLGEPYAEDPKIIKEIGKQANIGITDFEDLKTALEFINKAEGNNKLILICGSLHFNRDVKNQ